MIGTLTAQILLFLASVYFLYFGYMKHLLLLALLFCYTGLSAQEIVIPVKVLANTKTGPMQYVGSDAFGWRYTITDNEFRKEKDDRSLRYRNVSLGEISRVDLQNPLQIVLFYRKFNTVILLDNQLNETSRINFNHIQQPLIAEAVGLASQNRLWIYNINTQEPGLYDLARGEFKSITPPFADTIGYYHNDYNYFYWIDTTGKCYMANLFGKVTFLGNVPAFDSVQLLDSTALLFQKDGALYHYNPATQTQSRIDIAEKSFESFHYASQILTIFTNSEIVQYQITLPK